MTDIVHQIEVAEQVGALFLKGNNITQIARTLDMKPHAVNKALTDFRTLIKRSAETGAEIKDRLMDILAESDEAFRMIINEGWTTVSQADINAQYGIKVQALKLIESSTKSRVDMLQKAGMSEDTELIEHINEVEEKQELLINLLKEIKEEHPEIAELIAIRLSQIQRTVEVIHVES